LPCDNEKGEWKGRKFFIRSQFVLSFLPWNDFRFVYSFFFFFGKMSSPLPEPIVPSLDFQIQQQLPQVVDDTVVTATPAEEDPAPLASSQKEIVDAELPPTLSPSKKRSRSPSPPPLSPTKRLRRTDDADVTTAGAAGDEHTGTAHAEEGVAIL
jgi:hypothetical protein